MDTVIDRLEEIRDFILGPWLLIPLLLLTGFYLTIVLRGVQFHRFGYAFWLALVKRKEGGAEGDISHYQALTVALAATIGVGNIAGVGTAIAFGGPGALFWMWVTGLVGMATKYSEAFLGVKYRRVDAKGEQSGGPMFYLSEGINNVFGRFLAVWFAAFGALAAFGIGNMVQANSLADALNAEWDIPFWISGIVLMIAAAAVILGGIRSIGRFTAAFVPFMAIIYLIGATGVLLFNVGELPGALATIFTDAFTGTAATGGFIGVGFLTALRWGVARGIFSNESGLGTGGIAAAAAQTTNPVRQALVSMTQTFLDTLVVVTFTGLTIVVTGAWTAVDSAGDALTGAPLTSEAFRDGLPGDWGGVVVSVGVIFFAFSTLLSWSYYGERCMDRLFGRGLVTPYRVVFVLIIFLGSVTELTTVWTIADILNGLMALPNLIGLLVLSPLIARKSREFFQMANWKQVEDLPGQR
ncbi:sodium:alanine symporter family protein [Haloechinothrix sp. YIM 98757]|uniref:Sodium:alanine symporter family protein n=1 Tax=Haloechinothrix aidingensis TaxID=2752311 RepID=A0A838A929_9PSEU|nr:sodium:alanine symporter family protein [Haloechinothrix aidingensis]MBA0126075.1 sodium:alanine symporter family protein [Haloechinothrix aidingensis]